MFSLQGDILSSALYQTILEEDSTTSQYSACPPFSPDTHCHNGER